jgi:RsiW-degrading membrane proteinase PrsW (M82 family)
MFGLVMMAVKSYFLMACCITAGEIGLIYVLCGKRRSWWSLAWLVIGTAILTLLLSPVVATLNVMLLFFLRVGQGFILPIGPGLVEELFKAIPLFALSAYAKRNPTFREFEIREPLDGILLGSAAGFGFALAETFSSPTYSSSGELILWRFLADIFGHAAYTGYFGYFIGLAEMRSHNRSRTIMTGLGFSFLVHNAWDFFGFNESIPQLGVERPEFIFWLLPVGILTYAGLMAAILKAREISPARIANFATKHVGPGDPLLGQAGAYKMTLVGLSGPMAGERFKMSLEEIKLGRDPAKCQIVLADKSGKISRVHCSVRLDNNGVRLFLQDYRSTYGTFLGNGERLSPGQRVHLLPKATFYLGTPTVMFQVIPE